MKTTRFWIMLAAAAAIGWAAKPGRVGAQNAAPVPVTITPSATQYKVVDLAQIGVMQGGTAATTLEALLNRLGSDGWKLVTTTGSLVILRR